MNFPVGEQQRIVIARAILNKPEISWPIEPTGNLDVETGRRIVELLQDICRQGLSLLMTHAQPQLAFGAHPEECTNANIAVSRKRQIHRQRSKRMPK